MPTNVNQSKLMAQLKQKAKGAWTRARKVEPKARGQGGFPPNLKNIVAKCSEYKFAETERKNGKGGDPYFSLTGIVVEPADYAGRRATVMWFLNESEWSTLEQNLEQLANDLGLLGKEMPEDLGDVPAVFQELIDEGAHFIFNTGGPPKTEGRTPKIYIQGLAEGYENGESEEQSDEDDSAEGEAEEAGDTEEEGAEDADEAADEGAEEAADEAEADDWQPSPGDQYSIAIGKDDPANCEVIDGPRDDGKWKVKMLAGPKEGKSFFIDPATLETYIEPPKKTAKKPAAKPAKKGGKKK